MTSCLKCSSEVGPDYTSKQGAAECGQVRAGST